MLFKLLIKNAFRHKLRTFLTVVGITVSILAFGMLRTLVDAWYAGVEASSAKRLVTRNSISIVFALPISYKEKIRQVDGVETVSHGYWFGGYYIEPKNFLPNFAVEPESFMKLYPEYVLPDNQAQAFYKDRKGCVVGIKTMKRFGWKLGDTITIKGTIFPGDWELTIRGVYEGKYKTTDSSQMFFHWDYLNESLKKSFPQRADKTGFFMIEVGRPDQATAVSTTIDGMFKNSLAETLTETEKAFQMGFISMMDAIIVAIKLVSFVVIFIIMAVAANTMAMTARERMAEYAVLKTLGFGGGYLSALILGESLFISFTGCALGMALTYPTARMLSTMLGSFFPIFVVRHETLYMDMGAALAVGLCAAAFPAWRAARTSIAQGLGRLG